MLTETAYNEVNFILRFRKKRKDKRGSSAGLALTGDKSALAFQDGFGQGKSKPDAFCVERIFAPVKTLENMVDVFRGDAASVVRDDQLEYSRRLFPGNADKSALPGRCV